MSAPLAVVHHAGVFAPWSTEEARPIATGGDRSATLAVLTSRGVPPDEADAMLDLAAARGSSVVIDGIAVSASQALEDNAAGAFDEEVPVEDIFRHLLIERGPVR